MSNQKQKDLPTSQSPDLTQYFMPKSLQEDLANETTNQAQPPTEAEPKTQQPTENTAPTQPTEPEEPETEPAFEEIDLPEIEATQTPPTVQSQPPPTNPSYESLRQEAQYIAQQSNALFKQITGKDYDPLMASLEEQELFNKAREYVTSEVNLYKQQQAKMQQLAEFEQKFTQTEPKWKEILSYIQNEKPAKVLMELQTAIAQGDVEKLSSMLNSIRKEYYTKQSKKKEAPQPPFVEKPGTEPVVEPKQEFNPKTLRRAKSLEDKVKMLPVDLLAPKNILD